MKRCISMLLLGALLLSCVLIGTPMAYAAAVNGETRAIAIVFDNSGSMYDDGDQAWCRATYAMEVFASMLNTGDVLQIYPMWPITVGGQTYTMQAPLQITDAAQASTIRDIFTADAGGTPIESIDYAASGLKNLRADRKCLIVLTDGGTFSKNGNGLSKERTKKELDKRVAEYAGEEMNVMYLGIGSDACIPDTEESARFVKKQVVNTEDVLSTLTVMCNQIFGRDILPKSYVSGKTMEFDISMSKLIVFVQGENIADLKITGDAVGPMLGTRQTKYSTVGAGDYNSNPDTSLQGMMVTYADCAAGTYNIEYTGTETSVEVYYEPDADLDFIFTDARGDTVDPQVLYEGDYKVSFGMKDAKTGALIESELLGNPEYNGKYVIDGQAFPIQHQGFSGSVDIPLKMGQLFSAELTVEYLSGYTIHKDSSDFGWADGGISVTAPPLGRFEAYWQLPQDYVLITELGQAEQAMVALEIDGRKLTADEFDAVTLAVDCGEIGYELTPDKDNSRYCVQFKDTPGITEGKYPVKAEAQYQDVADRSAQDTATAQLTISKVPLWVRWTCGILLFLLVFLLIWSILHIKVLPTKAHTTRKLSNLNFDGEDVTKSTSFLTEIKKDGARMQTQYGGRRFGLIMDVTPGQESYLYKPHKGRSAEVKPVSVRKFGPAKIQEALIGTAKYTIDDETGKLVPALPNQKPFLLKNGATVRYSGTISDAGIDKDFEVLSKISFNKK